MSVIKANLIAELRGQVLAVMQLPEARNRERLAAQLALSDSAPGIPQIKTLLARSKQTFLSDEDNPDTPLFKMKQAVLEHDQHQHMRNPSS